MPDKKTILTREGYTEREDELRKLKTVRRKEVAEKIKEARGQGDLSENSEYDAAMEEQAEIEFRITALEKMLRNVEIIDEDEIKDKHVVTIGSTVRIIEENQSVEESYTIVGSEEADPKNRKISNESPLGVALIDHKAGDDIVVMAPNNLTFRYKLVSILNTVKD